MVAIAQNQVGQFFLRSVFRILIGKENQELYDGIDWQKECDRFRQPDLVYPHYYASQNFHGIEKGYLNPVAAVTYDAVSAIASPPNETWIRRHLITAIEGQPKRMLDLGCGTGTATLMLQQAFPQAQITGLDLSPYMLVMAERKAQKVGLSIQWLHALAEATGLGDRTFDLVTASFLFHEMPPEISQLILRECSRLLRSGGQMLILDGNQKILRRADWSIDLFREPYSKIYAAGSVGDWMSKAGFERVQTRHTGWIHQMTSGTN